MSPGSTADVGSVNKDGFEGLKTLSPKPCTLVIVGVEAWGGSVTTLQCLGEGSYSARAYRAWRILDILAVDH